MFEYLVPHLSCLTDTSSEHYVPDYVLACLFALPTTMAQPPTPQDQVLAALIQGQTAFVTQVTALTTAMTNNTARPVTITAAKPNNVYCRRSDLCRPVSGQI
jgi:hypothetical protein